MNPRALLVAWAGADWKVLRPLLDAGKMPNLARLIERGVRGNLATLQPQVPGLLWTGLATGQQADRHGMHSALRLDAERQRVTPVSSLDRKAPALWNLLAARGLRSNVVGWPGSHPAEAIPGTLVSDLFARVTGDPQAPDPVLGGSIHSAIPRAELEAMRIHPGQFGLPDVEWFVPEAREVDPEEDPLLAEVATALARCLTHHAAITLLLEEDAGDLNMVCYDPLDFLGPQFMALSAPRLPYVSEALFQRYRHVIPRFYQYLDLLLGRLVQLAGPDCHIVLISERGYQSGGLRPQDAQTAEQQLAAPWIREQGILVMAGPDVLEHEQIEGAGLLDIAPTVLSLLRLPVPEGLSGRTLRHALGATSGPGRIRSGLIAEEARSGCHTSDRRLTDAEVQGLLRHRARLREVNPADFGAPDSPEIARQQRARVVRQDRLNRALVYLGSRRPARALPLLRELHEDFPDDERITLHLARSLHAAGDTEEAAELMSQVAEGGPPRPREHLMLSRIYQSRSEPARALASLFRAEQASPEQPGLHCRIGEVYLQMHRWDDAERAFGKALALDADSALAHHGMAVVHLAREELGEALDSALTAVGLNPQSAQSHYHLGLALARVGQPGEAIQAFEASLALAPGNLEAHQWLEKLYREAAGDPEQADRHADQAMHLQVQRALSQQAREDHGR